MKRNIFFVLFLITISLLAISLTSCNKSGHSCSYNKQVISSTYLASSATCIEPAKYYYSCECGKCGNATFDDGEALGHSFKNATCLKAKTCTRCKITEGEALGHDYDNTNACKRCGAIKKREETPDEKNSTIFFENLWTATNAISSSEITDKDDILFSIDLNLTFRVQNASVSYKQINAAIKIKIIYDKEIESSALMLSLYDRKNNEEWISIYFYLDDPYNIYATFDGQNMIIGFDTGFNDHWNEYLDEFFNMQLIGNNKKKISFVELINILTESSGENFNFGIFVDSIVKIFSKTSPSNIYDSIREIESILSNSLGIEHLLDENNHFDVKSIFNSTVLKSLYKNVKITNLTNGAKAYSLDFQLNSALEGVVANLLSSKNPEFGKELIKGTVLSLKYETDSSGDINGFSIILKFSGLQYFDKKLNKYLYPQIELDISDINIVPIVAELESNKEIFNMPTKFTEVNTLDIEISMDSKGITLTPSEASSHMIAAPDFELDGKYNLRLQTSGDLNSDTIYLYGWFERIVGDNKQQIAEIAYNGETMFIALDDSIENDEGVSIVKCIFDCLGYYIMAAFEDLNNLGSIYNITTIIDNLKKSLLEQIEGDIYGYREGAANCYSITLKTKDLFHYISDRVGKKIVENTHESDTEVDEATIRGKGEKGKVAYEISVNSLVNMLQDIFVSLYITYGDTYGIFDISLPEDKTVLELLTTWFKLNNKYTNMDDWSIMLLGYSRKWFRVFTDMGFFDGYIYLTDGSIKTDIRGKYQYQNYKLFLTNADVEMMWAYVKGEKTYTDYVELMATKGKTPLSELDFNTSLQRITALYWDRLLKFKGAANDHWYEMFLQEVEKAQIVFDLASGVYINATAQVKDEASLCLEAKVNINNDISRQDIYDNYIRLSNSQNVFDLGLIQLCI